MADLPALGPLVERLLLRAAARCGASHAWRGGFLSICGVSTIKFEWPKMFHSVRVI
jgi:hypothetical protein